MGNEENMEPGRVTVEIKPGMLTKGKIEVNNNTVKSADTSYITLVDNTGEEQETKDVNIWLKFEIWDKNNHDFISLPANIDVKVMDYDPGSRDEPLAAGKTDVDGCVHFDKLIKEEENPDIYFLVNTEGVSHAGHNIPVDWSTKGWNTLNGGPGYYDEYEWSDLGTENDPLVFRIGVDYHLSLVYMDNNNNQKNAPKGIITSASDLSVHTDENGQLHGVIFEIDPVSEITFETSFEIMDNDINLKRADVDLNTDFPLFEEKSLPINSGNSVGAYQYPEKWEIQDESQRIALYCLKVLRELSEFLFYLTDGDWSGFDELTFFLYSAKELFNDTSYSWPVGHVNILGNSHWHRATIAHEISHQVMWKEVNYSSLGIAYEATFGQLYMVHWHNLLLTEEHALIEGWAEFIEALFKLNPPSPPYSLSTLRDENGNSVQGGLGPAPNTPNNRGQMVEGAFANGLWSIFKELVVTPQVSANVIIPESANGVILSSVQWIQDPDVVERFKRYIWEPMKLLAPMDNPASSDMIEKIRNLNANDWHKVLAELQTYNMAMYKPEIDSISPEAGTSGHVVNIEISGSNFVAGKTSVKVGSQFASNVSVVHHWKLEAEVTLIDIGLVDITVETPASSDSLDKAFNIEN